MPAFFVSSVPFPATDATAGFEDFIEYAWSARMSFLYFTLKRTVLPAVTLFLTSFCFLLVFNVTEIVYVSAANVEQTEMLDTEITKSSKRKNSLDLLRFITYLLKIALLQHYELDFIISS